MMAMNFVNPIEILELDFADLKAIDNAVIKKAKRKLYAEIELSDNGHFEYKGILLSKTDCEKVIDELENSNSLEFYAHLASDKLLNDYLVNGRDDLFRSLRQESIYRIPAFVKFIKPYFALRYDRSLLDAFCKGDEVELKAVLRAQFFLDSESHNAAFKSLRGEIQNRIEKVDRIRIEIENETTKYTEASIGGVLGVVKELCPANLLNLLPDYFQSQITKTAKSINFLQVAIWNEFNTTIVPFQIAEHLLRLNVESLSKPVYRSNFEIFKRKHEERIEQEKNAPILKKWAHILVTIQAQIKAVEEKKSLAAQACENMKEMVPMAELNSLPAYADEIRTQIAYSLRSLSISCWNRQNDIKAALSLLSFVLQIDVPADAKGKFKQDRSELEELEKKYKGILLCHFCDQNPPDEKCSLSTTIYKENSRSYFPKSVQFSFIEVTLPRCKTCKEVHSKGNAQYYLSFFVLLGLGAAIGALTPGNHFIIGGIIGGVAGCLAGIIVEGYLIRNSGIKNTSESTLSKHPLILERIKDGWSFSKPSA